MDSERASTEREGAVSSRIAALVRGARRESGLSQRAFASLAGTSGPTVAAYERGTKEPRLSTLERLAAGADRHIDVRLGPASRGAVQRERRQRRSLALAAAAAAAVADDFPTARALALKNLDRAQEIVGDNAARGWLLQWRELLDAGPRAIRDALLDTSERGHDLRQMAPFAGLLSEEERRAALAVASAFPQLLAGG